MHLLENWTFYAKLKTALSYINKLSYDNTIKPPSTTSRDKVIVCPAGESSVVHSEMTKRTSDYMSFSPKNDNGCLKNKKKWKWRYSRNIPDIPQQDNTDLHCIDILISTAFHTMGKDILFHTELQFDQLHMLNKKSTYSFLYIISAQFKHKMQNLNLDLAKQLKLSNPEETGKRGIFKNWFI